LSQVDPEFLMAAAENTYETNRKARTRTEEDNMLTEKTFDAGRVTIHYAEGPASGLPLVLLHDLTASWQTYLSLLPLVSCRHHTYALDLRGHGRSSHANSVYEIEEYGDDVLRFLRAIVPAPAVLVGHSLGAEVALWVAAAAPERVRAVVLEEPGLYALARDRFVHHPLHQLLHALQGLLVNQLSVDQLAAALRLLTPDADEVGLRAWATSLHQMDPRVLAHLLDGRTLARIRHDELLSQVAAPVLLLQGNPALAGLLTDQDVTRARALLPACTHVYRADLGHDLHGAAPLVYFRLVSDFVECLLHDVNAKPEGPGVARSTQAPDPPDGPR
jgi:pimeloyl-ACP methyl ester carboxylesterase